MYYYYKLKYRIPEPARWKHTIIIGWTGSGKSEFMKTLIHQHILRGKTAIVGFDPNGDFAEQVAQFKENARPENRGKLTYINPAEFKDIFPVINPLDIPNLGTETLDKVTQALHKTMMQSFKELDIKLSGAMGSMLYNMLHTLYRKEGSSLLDLVRFVDDTQNADLVELGTQTDNYVIRDYFEKKFLNPNLNMVKMRLAERINNFFAAQSLQRLIAGKTTIDLKKEINQRKILIFNLSKGKLWPKVSQIYGRFILTTLLNLTLARADIPEEARVPCHFYIDEFQNFLSDSFMEVFAEGRKYRVYLTVASQVIGLGMSMDMKKAIMGNANVKILGKAGYESRDEMKRQMDYVDSYAMRKKGIRKRTFSKLKTGRFIVQYGIANPHKIKVPKFLLGDKHRMSEKNRKKILDYHRQHKYAQPFYTQKDSLYNKTNTNLLNGRDGLLTEKELSNNQNFTPSSYRRKFRSNIN